MNLNKRILFVSIIAATLLLAGFLGALANMHDHSPAHIPSITRTPYLVTPTPGSVEEITSARDVAGRIGCSRFKDTGSAAAGIVLDSGSCWIDGHKYGIDTFATLPAMNNWLTAASKFGVLPQWKVGTGVVYKSVN
jgi:hypothetical protein